MQDSSDKHMDSLYIPEEFRNLQITGYMIAVNLPCSIRPPRVRACGVPLERFDVIGYVGVFPEPVQGQYLHAMGKGGKGTLYLRELSKDETRFSHRAYEYSLGLPTQDGQRNMTGLEPFYDSRGMLTRVFLGCPEKQAVQNTRFQNAVYIIRPCSIGGSRGCEILCLLHPHARNVAEGVVQGRYDELLSTLRAQTSPLCWQASNVDFMNWYNLAEVCR
jgi:hypothetical protein